KLFADERYLAGFRVLLRGEALDLILKLSNALFQLRFLAEACRAAKLKQLAFIGDGDGDGSLVGTGEQFGWKRDGISAVALGFEPGFTRGELIESLGDNSEVCARDRVVKLYEDVASLDAIAVLHVELSNHAAGRMLDFLYIGIDDDRSLRDER